MVTTYVNGVPVLTTTLTWTDAGAIVEETIGALGQNVAELSRRAAGGARRRDGRKSRAASSSTTRPASPRSFTTSPKASLQNIIINNASGRDLMQEIDVTLELPGFEAVQSGLFVEHFGFQISDDMRGIMFLDPGV